MKKKIVIKEIPKRYIDWGFTLVAFVLAIYLNWSLTVAFILGLAVYGFLNDYRADFYKMIAIIAGFVSAFALAFKIQVISKELGILSFSSLIILLIMIVIENRKEKDEINKKQSEKFTTGTNSLKKSYYQKTIVGEKKW